MKKTHEIFKRISMLMLSGIVALTTCVTSPFLASADSYRETTKDMYYLDLGLTVCEQIGSVWTESNEWGKKEPKVSSYTLTFNKGSNVVDMKLVDGPDRYTFYGKDSAFKAHYDEFLMNLPGEYAGTADLFEKYYRQFCATSIDNCSATMNGTTVTIKNQAMLRTISGYDVCDVASRGGKAQIVKDIYNLLGGDEDGEAKFALDQPKLYHSIEEAIKNCNNPNRKCYIVFKPTLVHYVVTVKEKVPDGTITAKLNAPAKVKVGKNFEVTDATILSSDIRYVEGTLKRQIGSGAFTTVATWQGPSTNGENSGRSFTDSIDSAASVTYQLTATADNGKSSTCEVVVYVSSTSESSYEMEFGWNIDPKITYEGHPILVKDTSTFIKHTTEEDEEGNEYPVDYYYNAYDRKGGNHYYTTTSSDYTTKTVDRANTEFRFWTKGKYNITVEESYHDLTDYDTDSVEILRTPRIVYHELSGQQKQNRKQTFHADIALNPRYPIEWQLKITDTVTGEIATLTKDNLLYNGIGIKTRQANYTIDANNCYAHIDLEFLSKFPDYVTDAAFSSTEFDRKNNSHFTYELIVTDGRGEKDRVERDFMVKSDEPPIAAINIENSYIREPGENYARITPEDTSYTDGDSLDRSWSYTTPQNTISLRQGVSGYLDRSFGTGQKITFNKEGVGKTRVRLYVKDIIPDKDTLAEYLVPSDYQSSEVTVETDVVNVKPAVSLEPLELVNSSVYLYDPLGSSALSEAVSQIGELKNNLLSEGIFVNFNKINGDLKSNATGRNINLDMGKEILYVGRDDIPFVTYRGGSGAYEQYEYNYYTNYNNINKGNFASTCYNFYGKTFDEIVNLLKSENYYAWQTLDYYYLTFWEDNFFAGDEDNLYVLNPNFTQQISSASNVYDCYSYTWPFKVSCYNLHTGENKWNTTVTKEMWYNTAPTAFSGTQVEPDNLIILEGGPVPYNTSDYFLLRTVDGTLVFQKSNGAYIKKLPFVMGDYVWQNGNYLYTYLETGIYKISTIDGKSSCIYSGKLLENPRTLNGEMWFLDSGVRLKLVKLNCETETFEVTKFGADTFLENFDNIKCLGIDINGKVAISNMKGIAVYENPAKGPIFTIADVYSGTSYVSATGFFNPFVVHSASDEIKYIGYTLAQNDQASAVVYDISDSSGNKALSYSRSMPASGYRSYKAEGGEGFNPYRIIEAYDYGNGDVRIISGHSNFNSRNKVMNIGEYMVKPKATMLKLNFRSNKTSLVENVSNSNFAAGMDTVTAGRNMGSYFISVANDSFPNNPNGHRSISVTTLPKTESEMDTVYPSVSVKEKEPNEYNKAYFVSIKEMGASAKSRISNLGYTFVQGFENLKERMSDLLHKKEDLTNAIYVRKNAGSSTSSLLRTFNLDASKNYYYEYQIVEEGDNSTTASISVKESIESYKEKNNLSYLDPTSGYFITGSEEDEFTDTLNPFFKYAGGKIIPGGLYDFGSGCSLTFTVPADKRAVFQVEYLSNTDQTGIRWAPYYIYATMDGKSWDRGLPLNFQTSSGSYDSGGNYQGQWKTQYSYASVMQEAEGAWVSPILTPGAHSFSLSTLSPSWEGASKRKYPYEGWLKLKSVKLLYIEENNIAYNIVEDRGLGVTKTFTVTEAGIYKLTLKGPANDTRSARGGLVSGDVQLKVGDKITYYLGRCAPKAGERQTGVNGSGYGDNGPYKSTISVNGRLIMVAGGAGGNGGDGAVNPINVPAPSTDYARPASGGVACPNCHSTQYYSTGRRYECKLCGTMFSFTPDEGKGYSCECGYSLPVPTRSWSSNGFSAVELGYHTHSVGTVYNPGGKGANGGYTYVVAGGNAPSGTPERVEPATGYSRYDTAPNSTYYPSTTAGGKGGSGGVSWVDTSLASNVQILGGCGEMESEIEIAKSTGYKTLLGSNLSTSKRVTVSDGIKNVNGNFKTLPSILSFARQKNEVTVRGNSTSEFLSAFSIATEGYSGAHNRAHKSSEVDYYESYIAYTASPWNGYFFSKWNMDNRPWSNDAWSSFNKSFTRDSLWIRWYYSTYGYLNDHDYRYDFKTDLLNYSVSLIPRTEKINSGHYIRNTLGTDSYGFYVEDKTTDGTSTITLSSSAPTWYLTSFSLYYLENGKKVYVINEEQMGKDKLKNWEVSGGTKSFAVYSAEPVEEDPALIYKKGEYVAQKVNYSDYEADPLKKGYWIYAHQAFNDGPHAKAGIVLNDDEQVIRVGGTSVAPGSLTIEQAAERLRSSGSSSYILTEPINRFYEDGKYHALYYAYDDTSRGATPGGNPNYDKASNIAEIVFYIIGESSTAPYIKSIKTNPAVVIEDENAKILTEVGDAEGDTLSLTVELFRDSEQILRQKWTGLTPNAAGEYPIKTTNNFTCDAGAYTVIATVRDATGVGAGTYKFKVGAAGKIEGMVSHTEKWDANRKAYNMAKFGEEGEFIAELATYAASANPRKRGTNVFWAGEAFCLTADVKGKAQSVTCTMYVDAKPASGKVRKREAASYTATLRSTGRKNEKGEAVYEGRLEDKAFRLLGQTAPEEVRFVFTATYASGKKKECEVRVIVDNTRPYELMHRIY